MKQDNLPPLDLEFRRVLHQERHWLEQVEVPMVTVSATFLWEMATYLGDNVKTFKKEEIVFSRAHFSQAVSVLMAAFQSKKSFWLIDPLNYVSAGNWPKILFSEKMGEQVARSALLKKLKDFMDTILRDKLPIAAAIEAPLKYAFAQVRRPIIAFHYEAGNILAKLGKTVLDVVTDPYVRPQYLKFTDKQNLFWAVFDESTKKELLKKAAKSGKPVNPKRVFVTGPPVDPRVVAASKSKNPTAYHFRPLRLAILTGGLGTNKGEIERITSQSLNFFKQGLFPVQIVAYAGTHPDFLKMFQDMAQHFGLEIGRERDANANFRILFGKNIVEANNKLLELVFPWADGLMTKPSGDMAYDGAAAGCFLLFLEPWGPWEEVIRRIFAQKNIGCPVKPENLGLQLDSLLKEKVVNGKTWVEQAIANALDLPPLFLNGAKKILEAQEKIRKGGEKNV